MSRQSIDRLLATRYLDDWAYQANVRTQIAEYLTKYPNPLQIFLNLKEYEPEVVKRENVLMHEFAVKYFPQWNEFYVSNPWHRMFECQIDFIK